MSPDQKMSPPPRKGGVQRETQRAAQNRQDTFFSVLTEFSLKLSRAETTDQILEFLISLITQKIPADLVLILTYHAPSQSLRIQKSAGLNPELANQFYPGQNGLSGYVFQTGLPVVVTQLQQDTRFQKPFPAFEQAASSLMAIPLFSASVPKGVILVGQSKTQIRLTELDLSKLEALGVLCGVGLDELELRRQLRVKEQEMELLSTENEKKEAELLTFNKNLKKNINLATKQLHMAYQKLRHREQELNQKMLELISMKEVGEAVSALFDLEIVLRLILNIALGHLKAEQGSVMLLDPTTQLLKIKVAQGLSYEVVKNTAIPLGQSIAGSVAQGGEPLLVEDIEKCELFPISKSDLKYKGKSLLCVPLKIKGHVLGVININSKLGGETFSQRDLEMLTIFASQAALAIEKAQLQKDIAQAEELRRILEKYVSPGVIQKIIDKEITVELGGIQKEITVFFLDIRGFTSLAEKLSPVEMVTFLNEFFGLTTEVIFRYEGTLDKFTGDGLMAIFGAPLDLQDPAVSAVRAAQDIISVTSNNARLNALTGRNFHVGIGINTGPAVAGNIGSKKRMEYTVIGDTVNMAYRLEKNAGPEEIVISETTYAKVKEFVEIMLEGILTLKGKTERVKYFIVRVKEEPPPTDATEPSEQLGQTKCP